MWTCKTDGTKGTDGTDEARAKLEAEVDRLKKDLEKCQEALNRASDQCAYLAGESERLRLLLKAALEESQGYKEHIMRFRMVAHCAALDDLRYELRLCPALYFALPQERRNGFVLEQVRRGVREIFRALEPSLREEGKE